MNRDHITGAARWPAHLNPGALRWARASTHYDETIGFYRDLVGLPVIDVFTSSFGEDGTVFGLPDTTVQMEIVRAHVDTDGASGVDQLVLYLEGEAAVAAGTARLSQGGNAPEPAPHPYWAANGAVVHRDPDGRGVVFAPWVYGRAPDPVEAAENPSRRGSHAGTELPVRIARYDGDRAALRALFEEAEDSTAQLDAYIDAGVVLVAWSGKDLVGHLQLVATVAPGEVELKNMAVRPGLRGRGIGRTLVDAAVSRSRADGATRMVVATAAADTGNLRFYQRCGFRFSAVELDAFTPETGYPDDMDIDGIPLRDRVRLAQEL